MIKKRTKEEEFIAKSNLILKWACIIAGSAIIIWYLVTGGFTTLVFDLRESKTVIIYSISIIILLVLLIIFNMSEETPETSKQVTHSSYATVIIIIAVAFFSLLFVLTLFDFFLPIILLLIVLFIAYHCISSLIKTIVNKKGLK